MQKINEEQILVSICTSTYNRAHTLPLPYHSICNQTYKKIEWIIVDGGSTDNTPNLINTWQTETTIPIKYVQLEKAGKHIALNLLFKLANGKYFVELDSDDELLPDAIERAVTIWESLPDSTKYSAIVGHCVDGETKKLVGSLFPDGINSFPLKKQTALRRATPGEKISIRKTEILRNYAFPEIPNIRYIDEIYIWGQIDLIYKQYCTNEIFRVYYSSNDSLSTLYAQKQDVSHLITEYWNTKLAIINIFDQIKSPYSITFIFVILSYWHTVFSLHYKLFGDFNDIKSFPKRLFMLLLLPLAYLLKKHWAKLITNLRPIKHT